mmetsp:Transcript_48506/g.48867  ORF Transcript_48506/g.48867 Transcript_48506/m.48867 type:complete len:135 (-) Transcript_48506:106-510(-)
MSELLKIVYDISAGDEMTNRVVDCLNKELAELKSSTKGSPKVLKLDINSCTKGSRWGRMCCAELGMGWIKLQVKWTLMLEKELLVEGTWKGDDAAGIGFTDLCDSDAGENILLHKLVPKLAADIKAKTRSSLSM